MHKRGPGEATWIGPTAAKRIAEPVPVINERHGQGAAREAFTQYLTGVEVTL